MRLTHDIIIGGLQVKRINSVQLRKSAAQLSDMATVILPLRAGNSVYKIPTNIKHGAKAQIKIGYDGKNLNEFNGYIYSIKQSKQLELTLEDSAYLLRQDITSKQYKSASVGSVVTDVVAQVPGLSVSVSPKISPLVYDKFTIEDATAYEVLQKIAEEWRIHIYVRGAVVHVALKFEVSGDNVRFDMSKNVERAGLIYESAENRKVQVEVVGITRDNKKVSVIVGDKGKGVDKLKINRYNVTNLDALRAIGQEEIVKWKFDGYKGDITTWLVPYCSYGYTANIKNKDYPEHDGNYYVEAVTTNYSDRGGSQKISLGIKL